MINKDFIKELKEEIKDIKHRIHPSSQMAIKRIIDKLVEKYNHSQVEDGDSNSLEEVNHLHDSNPDISKEEQAYLLQEIRKGNYTYKDTNNDVCQDPECGHEKNYHAIGHERGYCKISSCPCKKFKPKKGKRFKSWIGKDISRCSKGDKNEKM